MQKIEKKLTPEEAYKKLSARCARAECAPRDMERKLCEWELPQPAVAEVMSRLYKENFLNETRFAEAFVLDKFNYAHWGRIKIKQALKLKGISEEDAATALNVIPSKEYETYLSRLLQEKGKTVRAGSAYEKKAKLVRFAQGHGFEPALIFRLLENVKGLSSEDDFD